MNIMEEMFEIRSCTCTEILSNDIKIYAKKLTADELSNRPAGVCDVFVIKTTDRHGTKLHQSFLCVQILHNYS